MVRFAMTILASLIIASIGAQTMHVRLEVRPATTLPAIPVALRASFTSDGGKSVPVPAWAALVVTPADGSPFAALSGYSTVASISGKGRVGRRPVVVDFSVDGAFGEPGWFYSGFLPPGTYDLQLYAGHDLFMDDFGPWLPWIIDHACAVSNVVTLTVAEPGGVDAEIWKAMKALAGTAEDWKTPDIFAPAGPALVWRAVRDHPDSAYTGWLATMGVGGDERFEPLRQWLEQHPDDPYYEERLLRIAELDTNLAIMRTERSPWHEKLAREALAKLRHSRSAEIRERVRDRLQRLDERP